MGPPLNYSEAVRHYLSLPWTMRRKGAGTVPDPSKADQNLTCFSSPYVEGGPLDSAECGFEGHVYYPSPPALPSTAAPDYAQRKLDKCVALKSSIARQPLQFRRAAINVSQQFVIENSNITCGPEQLCYYPPALSVEQGGWVEQVNTELGVEVRSRLR